MTAIQVEQGSLKWHELRLKNIGSSEIATLFGLQPDYAPSRFTLWQVKKGNMDELPVEGERLEAGKRFELSIAEWIAADEGWQIEKGGYQQHPKVRGMGASYDHMIMSGDKEFEGEVPSPHHSESCPKTIRLQARAFGFPRTACSTICL